MYKCNYEPLNQSDAIELKNDAAPDRALAKLIGNELVMISDISDLDLFGLDAGTAFFFT